MSITLSQASWLMFQYYLFRNSIMNVLWWDVLRVSGNDHARRNQILEVCYPGKGMTGKYFASVARVWIRYRKITYYLYVAIFLLDIPSSPGHNHILFIPHRRTITNEMWPSCVSRNCFHKSTWPTRPDGTCVWLLFVPTTFNVTFEVFSPLPYLIIAIKRAHLLRMRPFPYS